MTPQLKCGVRILLIVLRGLKLKCLTTILFLFLFSSFAYAADLYSFNTRFRPPQANFIYLVPVANLTTDFLILGTNCLNITSGRLNGSRCLEPSFLTINFICENNNDCFLPDTCLNTLVCGLDRSEIEIGEVPVTVAQTMAITLPVVISGFFITIAVAQAIPFVGVFGGIMLMVESWFIGGLSPMIGFLMAIVSFIIIIFFALKIRKNKI